MDKESLKEMFDGWEVRKEGFNEEATISIAFQKDRFGLSIIAGKWLYSEPRREASQYLKVEVGLMEYEDVGGLIYTKDGRFFDKDVEGYVDEEKLKKIKEFVEELEEKDIGEVKKAGKYERYIEVK